VPTPEELPRPSWFGWAAGVGVTVLFAAGMVLALADVVDLPGPVVGAALLVAAVAAIAVVGWTWAESRRSGVGPIRSLGRSLRALGGFLFMLFF
jgi:hypothetical protein